MNLLSLLARPRGRERERWIEVIERREEREDYASEMGRCKSKRKQSITMRDVQEQTKLSEAERKYCCLYEEERTEKQEETTAEKHRKRTRSERMLLY